MNSTENQVEERIENPFSDVMSENRRLREILDESTAMRKRAEARLADLEEKCQELSEDLEEERGEVRILEMELAAATAQLDIVHLIFGGRQGGGCGGCH